MWKLIQTGKKLGKPVMAPQKKVRDLVGRGRPNFYDEIDIILEIFNFCLLLIFPISAGALK